MSTGETRGPAAKHLDVAAQHADLGLPVPKRTRLRLLKRPLGRVMWIFGRHQATYNHAMIEAVAELANTLETIRTSIPERVGNEVGSMRSQVGAIDVELRNATGLLETTTAHVAAIEARVDELTRRVGMLDQSTRDASG